jgi:hypothetical protein
LKALIGANKGSFMHVFLSLKRPVMCSLQGIIQPLGVLVTGSSREPLPPACRGAAAAYLGTFVQHKKGDLSQPCPFVVVSRDAE